VLEHFSITAVKLRIELLPFVRKEDVVTLDAVPVIYDPVPMGQAAKKFEKQLQFQAELLTNFR
jgi:hypothetical protein